MAEEDDAAKHRSRGFYGLQVVSTFGAEIGVGTLLGLWLDSVLGWTPWLTVTGATLGFGGGLYHLFREVGPTSGRDRPGDDKPGP